MTGSGAEPERAPAEVREGPPDTSTAHRLLTTSAVVTAVWLLGSLLGLVRDVLLADVFGASEATDAFLVAWTVPETATPLLLTGALVYLLVPAMSREAELHGSFQRVVDRTLLPTTVVLAALTGLVALGAPLIVAVLAPGLADPELAVRCVRMASLTVLFVGLAGYLTATLRSAGSFVLPTWVYVAYNVGIIASIALLADRLGIYSAAVGLAVGSAAMVLVQVVPFLRRVRLRSLRFGVDRALLVSAAAFLPIGAYTVARQGQVLVERFVGSTLDPGAISHLNYATKVAQLPMAMAGTVIMVAMPSLARHAAARRDTEVRAGMENALRLGMLLVVPAAAALVVLAPQVVEVLYLRGAFGAADAETTAAIMRVYSLGLLGQVMVGAAVACFFTVGRSRWFPAAAMAAGLAVTVVVSALAALELGAVGVALGNAAGITVTAAALLVGLCRRVVAIALRRLSDATARAALAATAGGLLAWAAVGAVDDALPPLGEAVAGGAVLAVGYGVALWVLRVPEARSAATAVRDRLRG